MRTLLLLLALISMATEAKPKKQKRNLFPFGTWMRSHEEDADPNAAFLLYRPDHFPFPPARGRSGIIVKKDGRFALLGPSAVDGRDTSWGNWKQDAAQKFLISVKGSSLSSLSWKSAGRGKLLIELR